VVIIMAVRWYTCYRLSTANIRTLLAERHVDVSARTILSWVHTFGPLLAAEGRRQARPLGTRWWCDETYIRVGGAWAYLYRAVDEYGQIVDVLLRSRRDLASAKAFFAQAILRRNSTPNEVITDKHPAYPRAMPEQLPHARHIQTGLHRASGPTCLPIERSHVPVKDRIRPMRGLQSIPTGQWIAEGIEMAAAIRRGDMGINTRQDLNRVGFSERARLVRAAFDALAATLRSAA
jgi:transposase-like protein